MAPAAIHQCTRYGYFFIIVIAISVFLFSSISLAAELSGKDIMQKVQDQSRIHKDQKFDVFMRIVDKKDRERQRFFTSWKKYKIHSYGLARFYKPVNLKNTGLLSILDEGEDETDQWLYLPAFRSVKKLSSNEKNKSFMGSDFSNSDMGGRNIDSDSHKLKSENDKYYFVESVPKSKEDSYSRIHYKIQKKILMPIKVDFFDHDNKLIKTLKNKKIVKHKGMYIAVNSIMNNPNTNSKTHVEIRDIDTKTVKNTSFFSTRGLKQ